VNGRSGLAELFLSSSGAATLPSLHAFLTEELWQQLREGDAEVDCVDCIRASEEQLRLSIYGFQLVQEGRGARTIRSEMKLDREKGSGVVRLGRGNRDAIKKVRTDCPLEYFPTHNYEELWRRRGMLRLRAV